MREEAQIDTLTDSLERETQSNALLDEKMEFFSAVEQGKLVLGDTLLHIAVRLGHEHIVTFLLLTDHQPVLSPNATARHRTNNTPKIPATSIPGSSSLASSVATSSSDYISNTTQTPNFKGELPKDVVGKNHILSLFLANVQDVHDVFGVGYPQEPKVHRLVRSLRCIWPLWMFDGQQEVTNLVRVVYDVRSSDPAFGNLVKVAQAVGDRFRTIVTTEGLHLALQLIEKHTENAVTAREIVASQCWTPEHKREMLFAVFRKWFLRSWKWKPHEERDQAYVDFFDTAMETWLQIVLDLGLHQKHTQKFMEQPDVLSVLKRYELQIWRRRVRPTPAHIDDLCVHIDALGSYLQLANLTT